MKHLILNIMALTAAVCISYAGEISLQKLNVPEHGLESVVAVIPHGMNNGFSAIDIPMRKPKDNVSNYWNKDKYEFIINGGFFHPDFRPVGFCRIGGKALNTKHSSVFSGYVVIDEKGKLHLKVKGDDLSEFPTVIQTGPHVIDPGGKAGIKSRKPRAACRTLLGRMKDGRIFVMITEAITLYDLSLAVKKGAPKVERLLNLDGGPSTAFKTSSSEVINLLAVRNYILKEKTTPNARREAKQ